MPDLATKVEVDVPAVKGAEALLADCPIRARLGPDGRLRFAATSMARFKIAVVGLVCLGSLLLVLLGGRG